MFSELLEIKVRIERPIDGFGVGEGKNRSIRGKVKEQDRGFQRSEDLIIELLEWLSLFCRKN